MVISEIKGVKRKDPNVTNSAICCYVLLASSLNVCIYVCLFPTCCHRNRGHDLVLVAMHVFWLLWLQNDIGWRDQARKMLLFSTDAGFHFAGDGKVKYGIKQNKSVAENHCLLPLNTNCFLHLFFLMSVTQSCCHCYVIFRLIVTASLILFVKLVHVF
jgi:hypothetical protein